MQDRMCEFFENGLRVLNPVYDLNSRPNGLIDAVQQACKKNVSMISIKLNEVRAPELSVFSDESPYRKILGKSFKATPESSVIKRPVELSSLYSTGKGDLNLYRLQLNNISYRSPPLPALYYPNAPHTFCNLTTIKNNVTKVSRDAKKKGFLLVSTQHGS